MRNYELLENDFIYVNDIKLYRIKSLTEYPRNIGADMLGGYIESYDNLQDFGWVDSSSKLYGNAIVKDRGIVTNNSNISGNIIVQDKGEIRNSTISNNTTKIILKDFGLLYNTDEVKEFNDLLIDKTKNVCLFYD